MSRASVIAAFLIVTTAGRAAFAADALQLTIIGGPQPGSSQAHVPKELCALGYSRPDEWSVRYVVDQRNPRRLSSLQLFVPDAKAAGAGTRQFNLAITFGPLRRPGAQYDVETRVASRRPQGTGTVTIDDRGSRAHIAFDATTKDGVKLRGAVDCRTVLRAPAPSQ